MTANQGFELYELQVIKRAAELLARYNRFISAEIDYIMDQTVKLKNIRQSTSRKRKRCQSYPY